MADKLATIAKLEKPQRRTAFKPERFWPRLRMPKRLERVRTGWVVHFRELALTRIPVKITTPSLLFESVKAC